MSADGGSLGVGLLSRRTNATAPQPHTAESVQMQRLERWTVLMYSKNCNADSVNEARKVLFTHGLKSLDSIPLTQHALFQHGKRALHTAAFVWKQSLSKIPQIPDPSEWGWEWNARTKVWVPYWTDLEDVSKACSLILHCGCVVAFKGNCKCGLGFAVPHCAVQWGLQ